MTDTGIIKRLAARVGGLRNLLALTLFLVVALTIPLNILVLQNSVKPLDYSYLFFAILVVFIAMILLAMLFGFLTVHLRAYVRGVLVWG